MKLDQSSATNESPRWRKLIRKPALLVAGALFATSALGLTLGNSVPFAAAETTTTQPQTIETPYGRAPLTFADIVQKVTPAVVSINVKGDVKVADNEQIPGLPDLPEDNPLYDFFKQFRKGMPQQPKSQPSLAQGSGFFISPDGYVVTNVHVVRGASEIVVRLADHSEHKGRLVGSDPKTDIALLKIDDASSLATLPFGDSDRLQVGEPVMAIGNPFGLEQTVTTGIVSAKERFIGAGPYDDFIQTDASINPGNSGGPLIDARGALIGINSAIFSQSGGSVGIGFAIPVNIAKDVLPQLRESGRVTRGYLGVAVVPVSPEVSRSLGVASQRGVVVAEVVPRSPAASAGIREGDLIVAFQTIPIQSPSELTRRVGGTPPGTKVDLRVVGPGGERTISVTLGRLADEPSSGDR